MLIRDNYQVEEIVARITRICKSFECPAVSRCARINPLHSQYPLHHRALSQILREIALKIGIDRILEFFFEMNFRI